MIDAEQLFVEAKRLGFTTCGVTDLISPPDLEAYKRWMSYGFQGEMDYLERHLEIKADPRLLLPEAERAIMVTLNYNQPVPTVLPGEPRVARYALGRDYHKVLKTKLRALERWITQQHPDAKNRSCVDSAPFLEREYAQRAGLGWFGKNTCLIDSKRGSWFFIGALLTSVPFEVSRPSQGGCGSCRKCIEACPTGAIVQKDGTWMVDARSCISYLTIEKKGDYTEEQARQIGDWTFGCDICQEVCPFNEPRATQPLRAAITPEGEFAPRNVPSLLELAMQNEEQWNEMTQGRPLRRAGFNGLKRNATANLGNAATPSGAAF